MSNIRVRRSGLAFFLARLFSVLTGLVFVVIAASRLNTAEFGVWSLIGKTLGYLILASYILSFWTTRYRARGITLGKTILVACAIFSLVLTIIYLVISGPISGSITQVSSSSNLYYFLLSSPQIALLTFAETLEALILGFSPEKNSISFVLFEIVKVILAFFTMDVLRWSLTGAIVSVILAQVFQIVVSLVFARKEFTDKVSFALIRRMVKTGWIAILNNLHNLVLGFDFLVMAIFTGSADLLAYFTIAVTISTVSEYSSYLAGGLYPGVLAGKDPKAATKDIFELQILFLCPMIIGVIILRSQLLNLINPIYIGPVSGILIVLTIGSIFDSLQSLFESTISASDRTDMNEKVKLSDYANSRLFLISKINLSLAAAYLGSLVVIGAVLGPRASSALFGMSGVVFIGILWAAANGAMSCGALILKIRFSRKIAPFSVDFELVRALIVGSLVFSVVMFFIAKSYTPPYADKILQALTLFGIGIVGLAVYVPVVYALSKTVRSLVKAIFKNIMELVGFSR